MRVEGGRGREDGSGKSEEGEEESRTTGERRQRRRGEFSENEVKRGEAVIRNRSPKRRAKG